MFGFDNTDLENESPRDRVKYWSDQVSELREKLRNAEQNLAYWQYVLDHGGIERAMIGR